MTMHKLRLTKPDGRALTLYARQPFDVPPSVPSPGGEPGREAHLRWHPLLREWVVYATHRQHRTFAPSGGDDPLAVTTDPARPTELPAGAWEAAVFENLFPALTHAAPAPPVEIVATQAARGACEVVVFTQDASTSLGALPLERVRLIVDVWADRTAELGRHADVSYVFPFENRGAEVGVTLHHPHGQIYAFPFVPPVAVRELGAQRSYLERTGRGLMADHLQAELEDGRRMVYAGEHAVAFVPVCARYPYEVWIAPRRAVALLPELGPDERLDLARALKTVLLKYDGLWGRPFPYLMVLHQGPTDGLPHPEAHVHLELYPAYRMPGRLKYAASTEMGAGFFSADATPEEKARELQAVSVSIEGAGDARRP
jgi:UDPglucose--hexose-1-phosphate uridylyltransferase